MLVVNGTQHSLSASHLLAGDVTCELGALTVGESRTCEFRAVADAEIALEVASADSRWRLETGRYVNPNFGWSGRVTIERLDPPRLVVESAGEQEPAGAR